jgi:hypothetical protein
MSSTLALVPLSICALGRLVVGEVWPSLFVPRCLALSVKMSRQDVRRVVLEMPF